MTVYGLNVIAIADIEPPGPGRTTRGGDLVGHLLRAIGADVGHGDIRAFGCEDAAHAAGRSLDEHGQALDRSAEALEFGHRRPAAG